MRCRKVGPDEVEPLHAILAACGRDLHARLGLAHWDPPHPLEAMRDDAARREVYAVDDGGPAVATFTVGLTPLPAYPSGLWSPGREPALYLNRLAVAPALQGRGLGRFCLAEVESRARALGCRAVRFDGIAGYAALLAFYRALGFQARGPFQIGPWPVECFERLLDGAPVT